MEDKMDGKMNFFASVSLGAKREIEEIFLGTLKEWGPRLQAAEEGPIREVARQIVNRVFNAFQQAREGDNLRQIGQHLASKFGGENGELLVRYRLAMAVANWSKADTALVVNGDADALAVDSLLRAREMVRANDPKQFEAAGKFVYQEVNRRYPSLQPEEIRTILKANKLLGLRSTRDPFVKEIICRVNAIGAKRD